MPGLAISAELTGILGELTHEDLNYMGDDSETEEYKLAALEDHKGLLQTLRTRGYEQGQILLMLKPLKKEEIVARLTALKTNKDLLIKYIPPDSFFTVSFILHNKPAAEAFTSINQQFNTQQRHTSNASIRRHSNLTPPILAAATSFSQVLGFNIRPTKRSLSPDRNNSTLPNNDTTQLNNRLGNHKPYKVTRYLRNYDGKQVAMPNDFIPKKGCSSSLT